MDGARDDQAFGDGGKCGHANGYEVQETLQVVDIRGLSPQDGLI